MNVLNRWTRSASALAAATTLVALAAIPGTANAAPARTATTTAYTDASFLQHALGLPTSDTNPAIEPVTYDRFQWLLQQPGEFAYLIGDPATDASFAARAQDVEAAAKAADVRKVYWFDPNLSGNAKVGDTTEPNLDIRNPTGITTITAASQTIYGNAWLNLVGRYLGDGVTATTTGLDSESAKVTAVTGVPTAVNDYGFTAGSSTKVGNTSGGALYDYRTATPANVQDSFFLVYDKDHTAPGGQPAKIVSWTDLTTQPGSTQTKADVTTAVGTAGAANLTEVDQFDWWKSAVNAKHYVQASNTASGKDVPVLTDADNDAADGGWRVHQITYPELVDLLKNSTDANAVILFGGTWCPNTRPVLPAVNANAQRNDVTVYNFDTVLDGGLVGGATTSSVNPFQVRNTVGAVTSSPTSNPTFLYGDLVSQYLKNIKTQYDPASTFVNYYPAGGSSSTLTKINKLQVPFVIGYEGSSSDAPHDGVNRQWIIKNDDGSYKEYMSSWSFTHPLPNQLGISTIPLDAPIWSTINAQLATFSWQTDPTTLYPNTAVDTDDDQYLVSGDKANVTPNLTSGAVSVSSNASGAVVVSPDALSAALSAVGASAPANLAAAKVALVTALKETTPDTTLTSNLTTIVGAWGVAQVRKSKVISTWGDATSPGSVAGGLAAVHALDVFFGGLPGGVVSRRTVTADPVTQGTAPKVTIAIANDFGRVPTGDVSLVVKKGGTTVASASTAVAQDAASFTLPLLDAGTYGYTLSYAGDDQIAAFTETGALTVAPGEEIKVDGPPTSTTPVSTVTTPPVQTPIQTPIKTPTEISRIKASKVKGAVVKAPTRKKAGKYKVTITTPKGAATASGKVTVKLKKGKTTKKFTGKLSRGVVTVSLPKLARGVWKVTISWPGDAHYLTASAAGASIKVTK